MQEIVPTEFFFNYFNYLITNLTQLLNTFKLCI